MAYSNGSSCKIVQWKDSDYQVISEVDFGKRPILGISFGGGDRKHLRILDIDGGLHQHRDEHHMAPAEYLGNLLAKLNPIQRAHWTMEEIHKAKIVADPSGETLLIWNDKKLLICQFFDGSYGLEFVNFEERIGDSNIQLLSICVPSSEEFFLLTTTRQIFRLGRRFPAPVSLTLASPPSPSVFSSLMAAGRAVGELQKASKKRAQELLPARTEDLFGKFNRELDIFLMGDKRSKEEEERGKSQKEEKEEEDEGDDRKKEKGAEEQEKKILSRLGGVLLVPEPERLTHGLQQIIGQIRQSSSIISSEFDHWSLAGTSRDLSREHGSDFWQTDNRSLPTEISPSVEEDREELISLLGEEKERETHGRGGGEEEVRVKRRRIMRRRKWAEMAMGGTMPRRSTNLRALVEERNSKASTLNLMELEEVGHQQKEEEMKEGEEQERRFMEVLNGIINNGEENGVEQELDEQKEEEVKQSEFGQRIEEKCEMDEQEMEKEEEEKDKEDKTMREMDSYEEEEEDQGQDNGVQTNGEPLRARTTLDLTDILAGHPPSPFPNSPLSSPCSSLTIPPMSMHHHSRLYHQIVCSLPHGDHWARLDCPYPIGHFAVCRHFVVICPQKRRSSATHRAHFMMSSMLRRIGAPNGGQQQRWYPLRLNADAIVPNDDGTRIWRISSGIGYSPAFAPDPLSPSSSLSRCAEWCEMTSPNEGKVLQVALTNRNAWYLTDRGVFVQMCLPENGIGIWFRAQDEDDPPLQFSQITASEEAVWALNGLGMIVVRTGLRHCPMGVDWVEMDGQPRKFISIGLFHGTGFGLDNQGSLWFIHGVVPESPFGIGQWLKCPPMLHPIGLSPSKIAPPSDWRIKIGSTGVFVNVGPALFHANLVSGSSLEHVVPDKLVQNDHFAFLAASGFSGLAFDGLFVCAPPKGDLSLFAVRSRAFSSLPSPSLSNNTIRSIWSSSEWLFVLDTSGIIHVRPTREPSPDQAEWVRFGQPAKFGSFVATSVSLWAISQSPSSTIWASRFWPSCGTDRLEWIEISGPQTGRDKPDQVRASPSGQSVCLFSSTTGTVWIRTDLAQRNWRGHSWHQIPSGCSPFHINDMALSDSTIWALAKGSGQLHCIAQPPKAIPHSSSPPSWRPMGFHLNAISVDSLEGRLWGLDREYRIVRHEMDVFPRNAENEEDGSEKDNDTSTGILRRARELPERTLSGASADSWCDLVKH